MWELEVCIVAQLMFYEFKDCNAWLTFWMLECIWFLLETVQYLHLYWTDWTTFGDADYFGDPLAFLLCHHVIHIHGFEWSVSTTIWWIAMKVSRHIHAPLDELL